MGFSLELFFIELFEVLETDHKASVKIRELRKIIIEARQYAKECGLLDD